MPTIDLRRGAPPASVLLDEGEVTVPAGVLSAAARAYRVRHPSRRRGRPRIAVDLERITTTTTAREAAALLGVSPSTARRILRALRSDQ